MTYDNEAILAALAPATCGTERSVVKPTSSGCFAVRAGGRSRGLSRIEMGHALKIEGSAAQRTEMRNPNFKVLADEVVEFEWVAKAGLFVRASPRAA